MKTDLKAPIDIDSINIPKLAREAGVNPQRIIDALEANRNPTPANAQERDRWRIYELKIAQATTENHVLGALYVYRQGLAPLVLSSTGQVEDWHVMNMFIWRLTKWNKVPLKSAK
jgi:hypothetical protein